MRCDMANMLRNAAECIDPAKDQWGYSASIETLIEHIGLVRSGQASLEDFADFYMLRAQPSGGSDA